MHRDRHIDIRSVRRPQPDIRKLSRALIALALAQAQNEADAAAGPHQPPQDGQDPAGQIQTPAEEQTGESAA